MEIRHLTCINCPMGCAIEVHLEEGQVTHVTGNTCPRGKAYAETEVTHPVRTITSILPVTDGSLSMVSCKTSQPVPKEMIFEIMRAMENISVQAPVAIGDILIANIAGSGADLIATKRIERIS